MSDAEKALRALVGKTARCDVFALGLDDDVMARLGLDSLAALRLLAAVEKHFGVRFPDDRLAEFRTLARILDFLNQHPGDKSP